MGLEPKIVGTGIVRRSKKIAVPAGIVRAAGRRVAQDVMVTIRQTTRLQVTGLSSSLVSVHPDDITNFNAVATSSATATLTWTLPTTGGVLSGVELNRENPPGAGNWSANLLSGIVSSYDQTGLNASTQYRYRIRPISGASNGNYSFDTITTDPIINPGDTATFSIPAGTGSWDGGTLRTPIGGGTQRAVQAGDIIELSAGSYPALTLQNIDANPADVAGPNDYITIRAPQTGVADIVVASGTNSLLKMNGLRFVKFMCLSPSTGVATGADGKRHGVRVRYTGSGSPVNVCIFGNFGTGYTQTRDIVLSGLEITANWSGPGSTAGGRIALNCDGSELASDFPSAWQENMIFEDMYIHNCVAEGIYCGHNADEAGTVAGRHIPVRYAKIRNCWHVLVGGNASNPKSWYGGVNGPDQFPTSYEHDDNNSVHDNVYFRCGNDNDINANPPNSPAVGTSSAKLDIYNNIFEACGGYAIQWRNAPNTNINFPSGQSTDFRARIYGNLIRDCGKNISRGGISVTSAAGLPAAFLPRAFVYSNTILSNNGSGITFSSTADPASFARNNISLGNTTQISWGPVTNENSKNLVTGTVSNTLFQNVSGTIEAGTADFHLRIAQLVAAGSSLATDVSQRDLDGISRILASADMGCYEF